MPEVLAGDVDRDVLDATRGAERLEHEARLGAAAGAGLDHPHARAPARHHLVHARAHDRGLGARDVVLGELADGVEELRAGAVVEVLRRETLRREAEAEERVGAEALASRLDG